MEFENTVNPIERPYGQGNIETTPVVGGAVRYVRMAVGAVAALSLACLMFLVAVDVICRYTLNKPVPGGYELTEFLMAILVPLGIAYCAFDKAHVGVDLIVEHLSFKSQLFLEIITSLVTLILMGVMTWQTFIGFHENYFSGKTSAVLLIPEYPFFLALPIGFLAFILFTLAHLIEALRRVFRK